MLNERTEWHLSYVFPCLRYMYFSGKHRVLRELPTQCSMNELSGTSHVFPCLRHVYFSGKHRVLRKRPTQYRSVFIGKGGWKFCGWNDQIIDPAIWVQKRALLALWTHPRPEKDAETKLEQWRIWRKQIYRSINNNIQTHWTNSL